MFTTVAIFRPLDEYDRIPMKQTFENRADALQSGRRAACLKGVTNVDVYDEKTAIASYNRTTNYWYEFNDETGNHISSERFFAKTKKRTEQAAIKAGINIRIRHQGLHWRVLAGSHSIPIDKEMLPWVSEAVEETEIKQDYREEDGITLFSDEELLDEFSRYLIERISKGLKNNPHCFSRLRWHKPFNNL